MTTPLSTPELHEILRRGTVIPAHPLALDQNRRFDERCQRALTRYYLASGAGGVAVGVHTTQFAIRDPRHGLLEPVLALASEEVGRQIGKTDQPVIRIAGICGETRQAVGEASLARSLQYDVGLLSLAALKSASIDELIVHAREVAGVIPLMGFYLQPSVGGRLLPLEFWRRFCEIENVIAIKIAPFNRYQTLDVLRAVAESGRADRIALYTGNDDNILLDLLTPFLIQTDWAPVQLRVVGGLLGHWAVWTSQAAKQLERIRIIRDRNEVVTPDLLTLAVQVTEANAALFDVAHGFAGCIAGIHEVLCRQGLMRTRHCLDPSEDLSPGQFEEIERIRQAYPHLGDDDFVAAHRDEWLA